MNIPTYAVIDELNGIPTIWPTFSPLKDNKKKVAPTTSANPLMCLSPTPKPDLIVPKYGTYRNSKIQFIKDWYYSEAIATTASPTFDKYIVYNTKITTHADGLTEIARYDGMIKRAVSRFWEERKPKKYYTLDLTDTGNAPTIATKQRVRTDNLNRALRSISDLARNNADLVSFLTFTFDPKKAVNVMSRKEIVKAFDSWLHQARREMKKAGKELKYIAVPELHKSKAYHIHLLTNVPCGCELIPFRGKALKTWNTTKKKMYTNHYYELKYWNSETFGYSTAIDLSSSNEQIDNNFNLASYMCKYLKKAWTCELFGERKYLHSNNLNKPTVEYVKDESYLPASSFTKAMSRALERPDARIYQSSPNEKNPYSLTVSRLIIPNLTPTEQADLIALFKEERESF